ncbi:MAG TPA: hypothetical protein VLA76_00925 [Candidatus Angelobacter sp.]|nr:hypothetical protein [Candidatus Angelobacter sp.]
MTTLKSHRNGVGGAVVTIDPRLDELLAIDRLDETDLPDGPIVDPRRFRMMAIGNLDGELELPAGPMVDPRRFRMMAIGNLDGELDEPPMAIAA